MQHAGAFIDAIQTVGIVIIAGALIFVVGRLDREVHRSTATLADVNKALQDQIKVTEGLVAIWQRILKIEARMDAAEQGNPPPNGTRPTDPPLSSGP